MMLSFPGDKFSFLEVLMVDPGSILFGSIDGFLGHRIQYFDEVFIVLSGGHLFLVTRVTCMLHDILILYSLFRFQSRSFTRWVLASIGYRCLNVLEIAGFLCTWSCFRLIHIICWSNSCRDITFLSFHLLSSPSLIQNRTTS